MGLKNDMFMCNCYIPFIDSDYHKRPDTDYFETLKQEISRYSTQGDILIIGDLNSRTGVLEELYDNIDSDVTIADNIQSD